MAPWTMAMTMTWTEPASQSWIFMSSWAAWLNAEVVGRERRCRASALPGVRFYPLGHVLRPEEPGPVGGSWGTDLEMGAQRGREPSGSWGAVMPVEASAARRQGSREATHVRPLPCPEEGGCRVGGSDNRPWRQTSWGLERLTSMMQKGDV